MKISKLLKRSLLVVSVLLVLLIAVAVAVPYFFKDELVSWVKEDVNKSINGTIDFDDVNLSLIRSFPDFNLQMENLSIVGANEFEGITLLASKDLEVELDLMSIIKSDRPIEINEVIMEEPQINIRVLKNGKINYDLAKADTTSNNMPTSEESYDYLIKLKSYEVNNGSFSYHDDAVDFYMDMEGVNHSGVGDFTQTIFDLDTETTTESLTVKTGGVKYLHKAKADLDAIINIDMDQMKYTLKDNDLTINALKILGEGWFQLEGDDINMDVNFSAPSNSFKNLLSLIPYAYTKDFASVQANGNMQFNGFVKGTYNGIKEQYPAFKIFLDINNGDFKYPDLPMGIKNILAKMTINSPSSNFDKMTIDVPMFKMNLGNNPFEANFNLKTPISDPAVAAKVNGRINLGDFAKAFPMEGVQEMNGLIITDVDANTRLSYIENQRYEDVNMSGTLRLQDIKYSADAMPPVKIKDMDMSFTPRNVVLSNFEALLGNSDLKAKGTIDNILAYFSPEKTMKGDLVFRSDFFDANEWVSAEASNESTPNNTSTSDTETEVFDRFDFTIDGKINRLKYDVYDLTGLSANGSFTPSLFNIKDFKTKIGESDLSGNGKLTNVFSYVFDNEILGGNLNLKSRFLNLNQFMEESPSAQPQAQNIANEENYEPIPVPENMNISINADIGKLLYTDIELKNVDGVLAVENETVAIKDASAQTMGGTFNIDGSYNTQNIEKPQFDLQFDLQKLGFQEAFKKFNTFEILAPIGKFIEGNFNTKMSFNGILGKDMMPDLNTLTAKGFLQTINGMVRNFKPLEELGQKLNVSALTERIQLEDTKNWFEVKDGKVVVKEFDTKIKNIAMKIGGTHGINMDMDYNIFAKIPREMLEKNAVGAAASSGLDFLSKEAAKYGVNIQNGAFINVMANLSGSIKSPKVNFKVVGADGESSVKDIATTKFNEVKEQAIDSVKTVANEKLNEAKDKANKEIDKARDSVKAVVDKEVNKAVDKAKDEAGKVIKDEAGKILTDTLLGAGKGKLDSLLKNGDKSGELKDKLKDFNPFKKKKKKKSDGDEKKNGN